jgi:serine protease Do
MKHVALTDNQLARGRRTRLFIWPIAILFSTAFASAGLLHAEETGTDLPAALRQIYFAGVPKTLEDLRLMDQYQQALVKQVMRVTVGLQIGPTYGSGVLVSKDGYVLTAAHVAGDAGREARVSMSDGQTFRGTTLGMDKNVDAALIKIDPQLRDGKEIEWPYAKMGNVADIEPGSWCLALGHPGGYQADRQPVVRFGRVLAIDRSAITTDCKLVGGDSGGPLFDMEGNVIGIHSRIGAKVTKNLHVPVNAYSDNWTRLARGDSWGSLLTITGRPVIGVLGEPETDEARIAEVLPASPAQRAGIRPGDLVTRFGDNEVETFDDLKKLVNRQQPGDEVTMEIRRGSKKLELKVVLAAMPRASS